MVEKGAGETEGGASPTKSFYSVSEIMHTIYLSDFVVLQGNQFGEFDINMEY